MASNYGELKAEIADWLDRSDLESKIPGFISFAERSIFRKLRIPANEKVTEQTITSEDSLAVPTDYLEARSMMVNSVPVERVSDIYALNYANTTGAARYFGRVGGDFIFRPALNSGDVVTLNYWFDESGMSADTDTTNVLAIADDLYMYATIMEAEKYLGVEGRIAQTQAIFKNKLHELQSMADVSELSGSTSEIKSAY
jgi:hypothetical protein